MENHRGSAGRFAFGNLEYKKLDRDAHGRFIKRKITRDTSMEPLVEKDDILTIEARVDAILKERLKE